MQSKWSDEQAESFVQQYESSECHPDLALRVYSSRLIGSDSSLVLHGGGNTSVKMTMEDDTGTQIEVVRVKASGRDLAEIEPEELPAIRLQSLRALRRLKALSDQDLANAQRSRMLDPNGPDPSVEALLHAFLPHRYIDHSHADAILSLVDQPEAKKLCTDLFEDRLGQVPYVMSGFALAKAAAEVYEANPAVEGLFILQHGLVTFGDSARESYERHIAAVDAAEGFCNKRRYWTMSHSMRPMDTVAYTELAPILRGRLDAAEHRQILCFRQGGNVREFVDSPKLQSISQRGPVTPDHVVRTKHLPMVLEVAGQRSVEQLTTRVNDCLNGFRSAYKRYVERNMSQLGMTVTPLDPDPRVILVPGMGMITAGPSREDAEIAADIYEHTINVILSAEAIGHYLPIPATDAFRFEYWSLEQAKLDRGKAGPLRGQIVYITGAASGIGAATARLFARAGACLYLVDRDEKPLRKLASELDCGWQKLDVTDETAVKASIDRAITLFGGLDGMVSNAGYAPQSPMDTCSASLLRESFEVNFFAHQWVAAAVMRVLRMQARGGFLLFNVSKAAFNPGAGFGPYALPKAAQMALMKQYALEGGPHRIRSNAVNADRIRTGLFDQKLIAERAKARGVKPDEYFKNNLLHREVTADDVAQAFLSLALAESTTGCTITVDGGNIAASPR